MPSWKSKPIVVLLIWLQCFFPVAFLRESAAQSAQDKRFMYEQDSAIVNALQYGSACNNTTISAALSAISSAGSPRRRLLLPAVNRQNAACTWVISSNLTIPSNVSLLLPYGSLVQVQGSVTLTLNACYETHWPYRVFDADNISTGIVTGSSTTGCREVYAEHWGAAGNATGDDAPEINAALVFVSATSGTLRLLGKQYRTASTVRYGDSTTIEGTARDVSVILCTTGICVGALDDDVSYQYNRFRDFGIQCEDDTAPYACTVGIQYVGRYGMVDGLFINRMENDGFLFDPQNAPGSTGSYYNKINNLVIRGITGNCVHLVRGDDDDRPNGNVWTGGHWQNCATGLNLEDGGTNRFVDVAIEGVTSNFMFLGSSGHTMVGVRMEVETNLPPDQGVVFDDGGGGAVFIGGTLTGGVINTSNLPNPNTICVIGMKINGDIAPDMCPVPHMVGPRILTGNPYGCIGPTENLLLRPQEINNAAWTTVGTLTVNANSILAPDGTNTAEEIVFTGSGAGSTPIRQQVTTQIADNNTYYFGIWLKADSYGAIHWRIDTDGPGTEPVVNGTFNVTTEWQYHLLVHTFCNAGTVDCDLNAADTVVFGLRRVVNDALDLTNLHVWGAHMGAGNTPKCYINGSADVITAQDVSVINTRIDARNQSISIISSSVCQDSLFTTTPANGTLCIDTDGPTLMCRNAGSWAVCN